MGEIIHFHWRRPICNSVSLKSTSARSAPPLLNTLQSIALIGGRGGDEVGSEFPLKAPRRTLSVRRGRGHGARALADAQKADRGPRKPPKERARRTAMWGRATGAGAGRPGACWWASTQQKEDALKTRCEFAPVSQETSTGRPDHTGVAVPRWPPAARRRGPGGAGRRPRPAPQPVRRGAPRGEEVCARRSAHRAAGGGPITVLLRSDGTAVACGDNGWGQCNLPVLVDGRVFTHICAGRACFLQHRRS